MDDKTKRARQLKRREAAIDTVKAVVTTASVAAAVSGWALISMMESTATAAVPPTAEQSAAVDLTLVGSPTPIPTTTTPPTAEASGSIAGPGATTPATATAAATPAPAATQAPAQVLPQPGLRQPPGFGGGLFEPRTRTSR